MQNTMTSFDVVNFVKNHWYFISLHVVLITNIVASLIVSSMDMPTDQDTKTYRFWFRLLNRIVANTSRAKAASEPGLSDTVIKQKVVTVKTAEIVAPLNIADKKIE